MEYDIQTYEVNERNSARFLLGSPGKKPLAYLGLNPSTADDKKPDMTIRKVMGFAEQNGYDSFLVFNLYPQRSTLPSGLHQRKQKRIYDQNLELILRSVGENKPISILAGWGQDIVLRPFLITALTELARSIKPSDANWLQIGQPTKKGHPRHPSRAAYAQPLAPFDPVEYLSLLYV